MRKFLSHLRLLKLSAPHIMVLLCPCLDHYIIYYTVIEDRCTTQWDITDGIVN